MLMSEFHGEFIIWLDCLIFNSELQTVWLSVLRLVNKCVLYAFQYVVIPTRRSSALAIQILMCHALGDAGSPYIVGLVSNCTTSFSSHFALTGPTFHNILMIMLLQFILGQPGPLLYSGTPPGKILVVVFFFEYVDHALLFCSNCNLLICFCVSPKKPVLCSFAICNEQNPVMFLLQAITVRKSQ